jgi:hypothetical protein
MTREECEEYGARLAQQEPPITPAQADIAARMFIAIAHQQEAA